MLEEFAGMVAGSSFHRYVCEMAHELIAARKELESLRWRKITPECLPKAGDEVLDEAGFVTAVGTGDAAYPVMELLHFYGFHYFRPINPPKEN
jgi:hypothetical protein